MKQNIIFVPLNKIVKNNFQQDVRDQEKVLEIAQSLIENLDNGMKGLLQVPPARELADGTYELAFGHHRFYAFEYLAESDKFFTEMPISVQKLTDLQMFRYLGIENLKRRDISPIEKGKMFFLFMKTFNKNSVETAKEFSTTDEDVRGSIRFLKLPEETQIMMEEGKIGVGVARELLSLGKVAGPEAVVQATQEMTNGTWDTPIEAVESALRDSEAVYLSAGNDWFAPKVFPVKHLKPLSQTDLIELLVFTSEPKEARANTFIEILRLISSGMEIVDEAFPAVARGSLEAVRVMVHPPKCDACPFHAVIKSDHYCGLKVCNERKIDAWKKHQVEQTAKKIGVPLYEKGDGEYFQLNVREAADVKLWKAGSPDLRLMKAQGVWSNFDDLGPELKVVVVGKEAEKRVKKAEKDGLSHEANHKAEERDQARIEKEAGVRNLKRDYVRRFTWEVASIIFSSAFEGVNSLPFMQNLTEYLFESNVPDFPKEIEDDDFIEDALNLKKVDAVKAFRRLSVFSLLDVQFYRNFQLDDSTKKPVIKHAENLTKIAGIWEVKLPKDFMKRAEEYQAELDKAIKEVQ